VPGRRALAGVSQRREISCTVKFLRRRRGFFFARGDLGATANLILITRQPRRSSPIAGGGKGVTLLSSVVAGVYGPAVICARPSGPRRDDRGKRGEGGRVHAVQRACTPLTVQPRPHSRDSAKSKHGCALVAAGRLLLSSPPPPPPPPLLPPARSNPPPPATSLRSAHSPFLRLPFSPASPSPRLHTRRQTRR